MNQDQVSSGFKPLTELLGQQHPQEIPDGPTSSDGYTLKEIPLEPDEYHCATCHDGHWIRRELPINHPDFGKAIQCPDCINRLTPQGIPDRLMNATFLRFDLALNRTMKKSYDAAHAVADGTSWTCTLIGTTGSGKSHLAAAALHQFARAGYFWETGDLLRRLRTECFGEMGPHTPEATALARWQDYEPLLVLDDMGAEKWTDWAAQTLYAILNARYQRRLPTFITSNVPDAVDERLLSRYAEGTVICNDAVDVRRTRR